MSETAASVALSLPATRNLRLDAAALTRDGFRVWRL